MRTHHASRVAPEKITGTFTEIGTTTPGLRSASIHLLSRGDNRNVVRSEPMLSTPPNDTTEILADIDGLPILVRLLVKDITAEVQSHYASKAGEFHSLLSHTLRKAVDRMRGSSLQDDASARQPLAIVELKASGHSLTQLPAAPGDTVLQVGSLRLDLLDRTAKRGDRQIDLRPKEFQLLKYMMQRCDEPLTRATLLKEVWHYRFLPETNLVDVHMGRLRRKVDGPDEAPLIRNVRGVGFVLSPLRSAQHRDPPNQ
jgi:DNA-binding winged helix-turn-helix (wHTH) protein